MGHGCILFNIPISYLGCLLFCFRTLLIQKTISIPLQQIEKHSTMKISGAYDENKRTPVQVPQWYHQPMALSVLKESKNNWNSTNQE